MTDGRRQTRRPKQRALTLTARIIPVRYWR